MAKLVCPLCDSPLEIVDVITVREYHTGYHVAGRRLPEREEPTTAALCTGCEFGVDLLYGDHSPRPFESIVTEIELLLKTMSAPAPSLRLVVLS